MKILIIDCNIEPDSWGAADLVRLAQVQAGATVWVRRAPQEDLPSQIHGFDRLIVSGSKTAATDSSPWIEQLLALIRQSVGYRIPFLGVCFGHQMMARALGGLESVGKAATPEFGWVEIKTTASSPLFDQVPSKFHSFAAHFDEVGRLPSGFKVLAESEACAVQACQFQDLPTYGIQFHPEKGLLSAEKILLEKDKTKEPPFLINRDQGQFLYREEIAQQIFGNFLRSSIHGRG